jgi:hypothetical protein
VDFSQIHGLQFATAVSLFAGAWYPSHSTWAALQAPSLR